MKDIPHGVAHEAGTDPAIRKVKPLHMSEHFARARITFQEIRNVRKLAHGGGCRPRSSYSLELPCRATWLPLSMASARW